MANIGKAKDWGEVVELNEVGAKLSGKAPIVFHFRPTKYLMVSEEKLKDFEKFFAENVGLRPEPPTEGEVGAMRAPSWCISGSNGDWDDCDYS